MRHHDDAAPQAVGGRRGGLGAGGGLELVLACDMVVAGETARFGVPEVKRGLVPAAGAALRLPGRVPQALALEMLLTGEPIEAPRAAKIGLVNRVTRAGGAREGALALAQKIAENGPLAVLRTKQIASAAADWGAEEGWKCQQPFIDEVFASEDAAEGRVPSRRNASLSGVAGEGQRPCSQAARRPSP